IEPALKNSSYKGPNKRFNSCCDGTSASAKEELSWGNGVRVVIIRRLLSLRNEA
nr:hypothetical protein [Tanacetum cinerariifolium]